MNDFVATLVRRWYLTIAGLTLTAVLCVAVARFVPPTYEATASVLLLPPKSSVQAGGNAYLQLGGLTQAVDVLGRSMSAQDTVAKVAVVDAGATYTAESDVTTSGPILLITVNGTTQVSTLAVLSQLINLAPTSLASLQSSLGIAPRSQITSTVLTRDEVPNAVQKTRIRALAAAAAVGLLLTAFGVAFIDGILVRRERRRHSLPATTNDTDNKTNRRDVRQVLKTVSAADDGLPRPTTRPGLRRPSPINGAERPPSNGSDNRILPAVGQTPRQSGTTGSHSHDRPARG